MKGEVLYNEVINSIARNERSNNPAPGKEYMGEDGLPLTQCHIVKLGVTIWLLSIALLIEAEKIVPKSNTKK